MPQNLSPARIDAYLARIGLEAPLSANADTLARLHLAHLKTVPFENLDIHLGRSIDLAPVALFDKIVIRRRGGFCYELNGLFAQLLHSLGFTVTLLSARVARPDGSFGQEFDHMTLRVDLAEPWLADVGFGDAFLSPLRLTAGIAQRDRGKICKLTSEEDRWDYCERKEDDAFHPQYRFTLTPRRPEDYREMCLWQQTAPESHFVRNTVCTLATENGRITISGQRFIETINGARQETPIESEEELRAVLKDRFGITGINRDLLRAH